MKFNLPVESELSQTLVKKIIDTNRSEVARLKNLENYYLGKHKILERIVDDPTKPNHKIVNPYPQYICDVLCGYFIGKPIVYTSTDEDLSNELNIVLALNGVANADSGIAKASSIFGRAYELHYVDNMGNARFKKVDPMDMIIIRDDTIDENIMYAIRIVPQYDIETSKNYSIIEVYSDTEITKYKSEEGNTSLEFIETVPHSYGIVPVVEYKNNEHELGDFENIIPLIDAYDILESDSLNDFSYFVDSYLMLTGLTADSEDIAQMKENRVILLDDANSKAEWLIKSENDTVSQNLKDRFKSDIHKFSKAPDLSDEAFSNNASGIAIKYKLFGTENTVAEKERYFKEGLDRRMELIFNILSLGSNKKYDWRAVEEQFTRNIPNNDIEIADMVQKLSGLVSTETLLAQLPFIEDVQEEMERRENTEEERFYDFTKEVDNELLAEA